MKLIEKNCFSFLIVLMTSLTSFSAFAGVNDVAKFKILPSVVVWSDNSTNTKPLTSDLSLLSAPSGVINNNLSSGNKTPVLTGVLTPVSEENQTINLFFHENSNIKPLLDGDVSDKLDSSFNASPENTETNRHMGLRVIPILKKSFFVASNSPFNLYAQCDSLSEDGEAESQNKKIKIYLSMSLSTSGNHAGKYFGSKAQSPSPGGTGFSKLPIALASLSAPMKVYGAGRKTTNASGDIAEQSVKFDIEYQILENYGLEVGLMSLSANVTYNVYIP